MQKTIHPIHFGMEGIASAGRKERIERNVRNFYQLAYNHSCNYNIKLYQNMIEGQKKKKRAQQIVESYKINIRFSFRITAIILGD